jgi:hypothetical protein
MYHPTKEELESIGFRFTEYWYCYMQVWNMPHMIKCYHDYDEWRLIVEWSNVWESSVDTNIYPQSRSDVEALIRTLTFND